MRPRLTVDVASMPLGEPRSMANGRTCLVVDVLRATSVLAVLLGRGMRAVYPAATIEQGRALRDRLRSEGRAVDGAAPPLLCGEVDACPPEGYDFGNSPSEFERLDPLPASAVVATTNGTPALLACGTSSLVIAAAPLNASAAVRLALAAGRDVLVLCAGHPSGAGEDDVIAAGLLVERLVAAGTEPTAHARAALERYEAGRGDLAAALRETHHGRALVRLGFGHDIDLCATVDRYDRVGVLADEGGRAVMRPASDEEIPR
jgi:2-phosphosulfolactate phosphatase